MNNCLFVCIFFVHVRGENETNKNRKRSGRKWRKCIKHVREAFNSNRNIAYQLFKCYLFISLFIACIKNKHWYMRSFLFSLPYRSFYPSRKWMMIKYLQISHRLWRHSNISLMTLVRLDSFRVEAKEKKGVDILNFFRLNLIKIWRTFGSLWILEMFANFWPFYNILLIFWSFWCHFDLFIKI